MDQAPEEQPRIPGVKYRPVTRYREETTVIDGVPSTRRVEYKAWEPVPPRDWDEMILRGVTALTIVVTVIAAMATTASVGGLLSATVPQGIAYTMGLVFTASWLACLALEWLSRVDPDRAGAARHAGWAALLIGMGAVVTYGHSLDQLWAGIFGACTDLLAKGLWTLLLRFHAVPLDAGVAHWVTEQEQKLASRELLAARLLRLNRRTAYQKAVGGVEYQAAGAILSSARTATHGLPTTGEPVAEPAPEPAPAPAPAPPVAPPVPSAPPVSPRSGQAGGQQSPVPSVSDIHRPSIAAICRTEIAADPAVTDAALVDAVRAAGHLDRPTLFDTVRRSALRVDPARRKTS